MLYRQSDYNLPLETLFDLPFPCFYVETAKLPVDKYHGFFFSLDQEKGGTPLLRCMAVKNQAILKFQFLEITLERGKTLRQGISKAVLQAALKGEYGEFQEFPVDDLVLESLIWRELMSMLSQLLLYISAQNSDMREVPGNSHGRVSGRIIKDKYREIRNWEVGYRVVTQLKKPEKQTVAGSDKNETAESSSRGLKRMSPRPHWRRSHWQLFWIGKRKSENRKFIIKWIPPTLVNCKSVEDLPVTMNQFRQSSCIDLEF